MNPAMLYRQNAITTQNRSQIVVLLYEGAIRFMKQALTEIQNHNYTARSLCLTRSQEIIFELNASLNLEVGTEIAKNLRSLYTFVWASLNKVNIKNDVVLLERLIRILEDLAGAWRQVSA